MAPAVSPGRSEIKITSRPRATLVLLLSPFGRPSTLSILLFIAAVACLVVAAWGFDWRAGLALLGVSFLIAEVRMLSE